MIESIEIPLKKILTGRDASTDEMHAAIGAIMDGTAGDVEIAALLTALHMKGEAVDEIVGAAQAMQQRATPISTQRTGLLDTCGTGGDRLHTFNISTATAFVAAACGVPVAKHGNRSVSSSSGSADVLETMGVNIQLAPEHVSRCLDELGIGFCFARLVHGAMKHAAPIRQQLGFRTIFNLLGPLTNPADAEYQLIGVNRAETAAKLAHAVARLGKTRALVVCGALQLDEVSLWGETMVFQIDGPTVTNTHWTADTFGLPACEAAQLQVTSAAESASVIQRVFDGEPGPARDIVLANSAAALLAARFSENPKEAVSKAAEALDTGAAAGLVRRLAELTQQLGGTDT